MNQTVILTFLGKADPAYAGERSHMGFPGVVGGRGENVPGILDCGFDCSPSKPSRTAEAGKLK